jgi:aldose 1-epimerase
MALPLHRVLPFSCALFATVLVGCTAPRVLDAPTGSKTVRRDSLVVELKREKFQKTVDGKPVDLYTLRNAAGAEVSITNYGAKIEPILVPDRQGVLGDVVLGYASIDGVIEGQPSMNAFIGRYANRIGGARFTLDGQTYQLAANNGPNTLHGGTRGSRFQVFDARQLSPRSVEMRYVFRDGEENFPGTLPVRVGSTRLATITR